MREITYGEAIREAQREEMRRDKNVFIIGEDVRAGMTFRATGGLVDEFGKERVIDTPLSELAIVGAGIGAAILGMRPIIEIQVANFITLAMDQIINQAAKLRYISGGQLACPIVIRSANGYWQSFGAHHSDSVESWFMGIPGLKIAVPSTPLDAKGLLKAAIRDDAPVIFLEHKRLYGVKGSVPEDEDFVIPFGKADIKRQGNDVTIVAISFMVRQALRAAEILQTEGIDAEVIDPRTLLPLDKEAIIASIGKTGRLVVVEEGPKTGGVAAEIISVIAEDAFFYLDAPPKRVAGLNTPMPFSPPLEDFVVPNEMKIVDAVKQILS